MSLSRCCLLVLAIVSVSARAFAQSSSPAQAPPAPPPPAVYAPPPQQPAAPPPAAQPPAAQPPPAQQPGPAQDPAMVEARRHFVQGVALYNDGDFGAALAEFEATYKASPIPAVLYNLGLTNKALFRYAEAVDWLTRYLRDDITIAPERRAEVEMVINEMKSLLAEVRVTVTPDTATVVLDGRGVKLSPTEPLRLKAGQHVFEISAEWHQPERREITVTAGVPMQLSVALKAIPRTGKIRLTSSRPQALVTIDGRNLGFAPMDVELTAGGHALEVSSHGYKTHRSELTVGVGQDRTVNVELEKPAKKLYQQWWIWTIAAVVAGGAATAIAVPLSSRVQDPLPGTLGVSKVD